ncbi:lysophospholipid acyltransferase family protein [Aliikangiella sp. IMCC44653]
MNESAVKIKKAGKIQFLIIAFMTGVYTFWYSSKVVMQSIFCKDYRAKVDESMQGWAKKLVGLIKVKLKVVGEAHLNLETDRPLVVMCNHSSLYDIPISILVVKKSLRMLAKKELFKIPVFAAALRRGEFVSIDRHNRERSFKDLVNAKQKMLDGVVLWVAPEGTRSQDGQLAPFKRGAFHIAIETKALIIPMVIKDIHKVQAGTDLSLYLNQDVNVEVCQPVDAADYDIDSRKALIEKVRLEMLTALGQNRT